jgi:uncharacterized protein (TIGR03437 family)
MQQMLGSLVPTANIIVSLPTNITSRLLPNGASEALLLIDEPGQSVLSGAGPKLPQTVCDSLLGASAGGCVGSTPGAVGLYANYALTPDVRSSSSQCTAFTGARCTVFGDTPNVFMGAVSDNQVIFTAIPVLAPMTSGMSRVYRITNIRVNAAGLGSSASGPVPLLASVSISGSSSLPIANHVQTVGFVQSGLSTSVRNAANSGALVPGPGSSLSYRVGIPLPNPWPGLPVPGATLRFSENFGTAFKTLIAPTATTTGLHGVPPFTQNVPGNIYNSESGFIAPTPTGWTGLADYGTRLRARFTNIPAGVNVFVTTSNYQGTNGSGVGTGTMPSQSPPIGATSIAFLVQSATAPDSGGYGPFDFVYYCGRVVGNVIVCPLNINNGSGEAVWEVVSTNPNALETFDFGVYFSSPTRDGPYWPGTGVVDLSYAPAVTTSTACSGPVPTFVDVSNSANIVNVTGCVAAVVLSSAPAPSVWGQPVTMTATVTGSLGCPTPTGAVEFLQFGQVPPLLGTTNLNGSGQATFSTSSLSVGNHLLFAFYPGDTNYPLSALSGWVSQLVNQASQTITFGPLTTRTYGAAPFTVSASASSSLAVGFASTTQSVCTVTGSTVTIVGAGSCSITASQAGNSNYLAASNVAQGFTVNKAVLTVTADYAAKVAGAAMPSLTVTITGLVNNDPRSVVTGAPSLTTTATAASPAGSYPIIVSAGTLAAANYSFVFVNGTLIVNNAVSSNVGGHTPAPPGSFIGQSFTTPGGGPWTSITFSFFADQGQTPGAAGTAYLFTQPYTGTPGDLAAFLGHPLVVAARGGAKPHVVPAGFLAASTGTSGGAYFFAPSLTLQSNTRYYLYVDAPAGSFPAGIMTGGTGDTSFAAGSSSSGFVTSTGSANFLLSAVSTAPPTPPIIPPPLTSSVSLTSSGSPSALGQSVTFTATVSGSSGQPTGTVQFLDGSSVMGTSSIGAGGQAVYSTKTLGIGSHVITAGYGGDTIYPGSQASIAQTVNALASTTTLTSAATSPVYGQPVVLTAAVAPATPSAGFAAPTGQVSFYLGGNGPVGRTLLGTAALSGGSATFTVPNLATGASYLLAQYGGDATWASSLAQLAVTVSPAPTSTSVSLNLAGGKPVLSAAVTAAAPATGTPAGAVQFIDTSNGTVVANASLSNGSATASPAAQSVLARPIAAIYAGDANFQGSTSPALPRLTNGASGSSVFAPDQLATVFGVTGLSGDTPGAIPLGDSLAGVSLKIADSEGTGRMALLYGVFASAGQINFVMPAGTASGMAGVTLNLPGGNTISTAVEVGPVAPGIFTANMTGAGVYAGQVLHVLADGSQTIANPALWDDAFHAYKEGPIDLGGAGERVFLVLYGTGLSHAASVTATAAGISLPVVYFGPQGQFPGIDQVNVQLPSGMAGAGLVNLTITADGQPANTVTLRIR